MTHICFEEVINSLNTTQISSLKKLIPIKFKSLKNEFSYNKKEKYDSLDIWLSKFSDSVDNQDFNKNVIKSINLDNNSIIDIHFQMISDSWIIIDFNSNENWITSLLYILCKISFLNSDYKIMFVDTKNFISVSLNTKSWKKDSFTKFCVAVKFFANSYLQTKENSLQGKMIKLHNSVGWHLCRNGKKISIALETIDCKLPYQIFIGSNISSKCFVSQDELQRSAEIMTERNLCVFVHSPYIINLCTIDDNTQKSHFDLLNKNLIYASQMKMQGVVVHVGKNNKNLSIEDALTHMKNQIIQSLQYTNPNCPLLLETPAGQGTEVLTDPDEFCLFCLKIDNPNFGICLDTCHVFSAGTLPMNYIKCIQKHNLLSKLKLVHFNDSEGIVGCKVDRHASIGKGEIPLQQLKECAEFCKENNIPMLTE